MNDRNDGDDRKRGRGAGPRGENKGGGGRPGAGDRGARSRDGGFKREGGGGTKPFRSRPPRRDESAGEGGGGERRSEQPKKPFGERGDRPKREGGFKRGEGGDGKPFRARPPRAETSEGDRGERRFDRPRKTEDAGERPSRPRREGDAAEAPGGMRIAKRLARAGIASRRDAEAMIADGRVRLNGHLVETPATIVQSADRIEIDGEALPATERTRLWLYHKPAGLVTTNRDPEGRPTVFDRLPDDLPRVLSVGRLDINTEGLLLLTNDGGLSRTLELPSTGWLRRYRVRAHGTVSQAQLDELKHGIAIDGVFYGAIEAVLDSEKGANVWMTLGLREGKNREVKRILGHLGLEVNRLIRISFGPFQLGELPEGAVREIKGRTLRDQLGERLIEESGADFDAPIVNPFTNEVVEQGAKPRRTEAPERREERAEKSEWVTAKGDAKPAKGGNRKEFGREKRESALSRLDTRPARGPRRERDGDAPRGVFKRDDAGKRFGRDEAAGDDKPARPKPGARRSANVWIAPGGRPLGEEAAARKREREASGETGERGAKPFRSRGFRDAPSGAAGKSDDGTRPRRSAGFRQQTEGRSFGEGDRPRGARKDGGGGGRPFGGGGKPGGGGGRSGPPGGRRGPKGS